MLKWARNKMKQDIKEIEEIKKQRKQAISELEKLNRQLKKITNKK